MFLPAPVPTGTALISRQSEPVFTWSYLTWPSDDPGVCLCGQLLCLKHHQCLATCLCFYQMKNGNNNDKQHVTDKPPDVARRGCPSLFCNMACHLDTQHAALDTQIYYVINQSCTPTMLSAQACHQCHVTVTVKCDEVVIK